MKRIFITIGVIAILIGTWFAVQKNSTDSYLLQIQKNGLQSFIDSHKENGPAYENLMWDEIFPQIAAGDEEWIDIGFKMYRRDGVAGLGASIGETLDQPLGMAITSNPQKVFSMIKNGNNQAGEISRLCSSTKNNFNDSETREVDEEDFKVLVARKSAIEKISDAALLDIKQKCLQNLSDRLKFIERKLK